MPRRKKVIDPDLEKLELELNPQPKKRKLSKKELQILEIANNTVLPENYFTVWTEQDLEDMLKFFEDKEYIAVDTETMGVNPFKDEIVGISLYAPAKGFYIPLKHRDNTIEGTGKVGIDYVKCLKKEYVAEKLKPLLTSKKLVLHNAKFDMHVIKNWLGFEIEPYFDTMIAQWLLDENQPKSLKELATIYLKIEADKFSELFGKETFDTIPILLNPETRTGNLATYYAVKDVEMTYKLFEFQSYHLRRETLKEIANLFYNIEMPLLKIVYQAEQYGVLINTEYLAQLGTQLKVEINEITNQIKQYLGDINLNSPKQVSKALYEDLKLPKLAPKDKPGTDSDTLELIKDVHPVVDLLLKYREKMKLLTAFVEAIPEEVIDSRIHTNFKVIGAVTGRMASENPNLQQMHPNVRLAFEAEKDRLLVSIDYSAQELRLLAHFSEDPILIDIYKNDGDMHAMTAVAIWNMKNEPKVDYDYFQYCREMTVHFQNAEGELVEEKFHDDELLNKLYLEGIIKTYDIQELKRDAELGIKFEKIRKSAKSVNFGIIYGISPKGLAKQLLINETEAEQYIEVFFQTYPRVEKWIEEVQLFAKRNKYVKTILGRKRRLYPELDSNDPIKYASAMRMAVNSIIQGSGADMVKQATVLLQPFLKEINSYIVMWIHDEVVFNVPLKTKMEDLKKIIEIMANAIPLKVPMKCDIEIGKRWGEKIPEEELGDYITF